MEENKVIVYAKLDKNNVIIQINSNIFIQDLTGWTRIDEGTGDKFTHAQSNYLAKGIIDNNGNYNYKLVDGNIVELTDGEKGELCPLPIAQPNLQDILNSKLLKDNAENKTQLDSQKALNAQLLLDIAKLKGGN